MQNILSKEEYNTFTEKVDVSSMRGVTVPYSVEYGGTVGEPTFTVTLLNEDQDLESIMGEV